MGRVIHFEIPCDDVDRAERFYSDVFGWRIQRWDGPFDYRLATTGTQDEAGIDGALVERGEPAPPDDGAGTLTNTIAVDDVAATGDAIVAAGGKRLSEAAAVPGIGTVAYFTDTEGNRLCALQPDPAVP